MNIKDYGGEFALIDLISRRKKDKNVLVGVGDDTAVIKYNKKYVLLWTTDMLVEGDHFNLKWSTSQQIGKKAMEINVSDIASMGGLPKYALISISLPDDTQVEFIDQLYKGMRNVCKKYDFEIVGGNTTHGQRIVIDISLIGMAEKKRLCLRSNAKVGDLICVTGYLGKSAVGLETLRAGLKGNVKDHLEPECRLNEARVISKYANAMIDVSDGLASEVNHICKRSNVGAKVVKEKIPISKNTFKLANKLGKDAYGFALDGGEDFELVFTIPERKLDKIKVKCPVTVVGRIVEKRKGIYLIDKGKKTPLEGGYDHFNSKKA